VKSFLARTQGEKLLKLLYFVWIQVFENATVGTEVLKLQAKDMDKGYNGLLTFVISGGDEAHGAWDIVNSGNIIMGGGSTDQASLVVAAPLDREEIASYVLNISVWDQGKPPKFTSKLLQIKVGLSEY
jgi:protocadherin Fat 1/2/3